MKGLSLLRGLALVSNWLPSAAPVLGGSIGVLSILDYAIGNYQEIIFLRIEIEGIETITDVVDMLDLRAIRMLREVKLSPLETVMSYADYLEKVSMEISKGVRDLRTRLRAQQDELLSNLRMPAPVDALNAVNNTVHKKEGD